jgi:Uma2 family endonuclease
MSTKPIVLNYQDYTSLPADGRRYEVHEGELSVTPAPSPRHQMISGNLFYLLHGHVKARGLGVVLPTPIDVILSDISIVQPDIVFVDQTRLGQLSERGIEGAPTLVIEVLSPSTVGVDRRTKHRLYARHSVPYYWIVDPEARMLEAWKPGPDGYSLAVQGAGMSPINPPPFPDLGLVPASLWP